MRWLCVWQQPKGLCCASRQVHGCSKAALRRRAALAVCLCAVSEMTRLILAAGSLSGLISGNHAAVAVMNAWHSLALQFECAYGARGKI
jgi:hypothetical protein